MRDHFQAVHTDTASTWDNDVQAAVACHLLAENYRLTTPIAFALNLLNCSDVARIIGFAANPEEFQKLVLRS